jgi:hypothetical protein
MVIEVAAGGALSRHRLLEGETTGQMIHGEIEEESVARRFISIRVRKGVHRRRAEWGRQPRAAAWPSAGGLRAPGWAIVGPCALGPKADGADFGGIQKKWRRARTREWAKIKE